MWLGDASALDGLPENITAVVSLCLLGRTQVPNGVAHVGYRLIDHSDAAVNPNLDYLIIDAARTIATLREEGHEVLVHCVAAQSRTPTIGAAYAMLRGIDAAGALADICAVLPAARPNTGFLEALRRLELRGLR